MVVGGVAFDGRREGIAHFGGVSVFFFVFSHARQ